MTKILTLIYAEGIKELTDEKFRSNWEENCCVLHLTLSPQRFEM